MSCFNSEDFLEEAIDSIRRQTFENWELIVVNDGSTDRTHFILQSYRDARIRTIELRQNQGIPRALNLGLQAARGEFVARLDADDIAESDRLQIQTRFLDSAPEVVLTGGLLRTLGEVPQRVLGVQTNRDVGPLLLCGNQLLSSSVMFRRSVIDDHDLRYREDLANAQDYELWLQFAQFGALRVQQIVVGSYRFHSEQETVKSRGRQRYLALQVQLSALRGEYRIPASGFAQRARGLLSFIRHLAGFARHKWLKIS